jgi:hypothetical protein
MVISVGLAAWLALGLALTAVCALVSFAAVVLTQLRFRCRCPRCLP